MSILPPPVSPTTPTVLEMQVGDYFVQGRLGWVHLHEKGGRTPTA